MGVPSLSETVPHTLLLLHVSEVLKGECSHWRPPKGICLHDCLQTSPVGEREDERVKQCNRTGDRDKKVIDRMREWQETVKSGNIKRYCVGEHVSLCVIVLYVFAFVRVLVRVCVSVCVRAFVFLCECVCVFL